MPPSCPRRSASFGPTPFQAAIKSAGTWDGLCRLEPSPHGDLSATKCAILSVHGKSPMKLLRASLVGMWRGAIARPAVAEMSPSHERNMHDWRLVTVKYEAS